MRILSNPGAPVPFVASGLFIAVLALLLATSLAISIRERPLRQLLRRLEPSLGFRVSDRAVFLGVLLLFDLVGVGLLAHFGTALS